MNIAIVGSREYPDLQRVANFVGGIARLHPDAIIISGGAPGVDEVGESVAHNCGLLVYSIRPYKDHRLDRIRWAELRIAPNDRYPGSRTAPAHLITNRSADSWPNWRDAYFARNEVVVKLSDQVCAFTVDRPGGTTNTINHAHRLDVPVHEYQLPLKV